MARAKMCCILVCVYGLQVHDSTDACAGSFVDGQTNCVDAIYYQSSQARKRWYVMW